MYGRCQGDVIQVDDLKVVSRTNNPDRFAGYKEFILSDSKTIRVNVYDGMSCRCTHYTYTLLEKANMQEADTSVNKPENQLKVENAWLKMQIENVAQHNKKLEEKLAQTTGVANMNTINNLLLSCFDNVNVLSAQIEKIVKILVHCKEQQPLMNKTKRKSIYIPV